MIEVRLFATLREGREKQYELKAEEVKSGRDIIDSLNIPQAEVSIYLINGRHKRLSDSVEAGDVVAIFPPVGGG